MPLFDAGRDAVAEFNFQPFLDRDMVERWVVVDVWVSVSIF